MRSGSRDERVNDRLTDKVRLLVEFGGPRQPIGNEAYVFGLGDA